MKVVGFCFETFSVRAGTLKGVVRCKLRWVMSGISRHTVPKVKGWRWFKVICNRIFPVHKTEKKKIREITTVYAPVNGKIHSILL
jgi:hypothetical protein